jgi:hypothetical protein
MISRFVTVAALATGAALFCLPAQAQTGMSSPGTSSPGTSSQSTINPGGTSSGSVGTGTAPGTYNPPPTPTAPTMGGTAGTTSSTGMNNQGTMSGQSGSMATQGSMGAQGNTYGSAGSGMGYQAQATPGPGRMRRGNAAERQMTECLNNAAAQHQPLDSCRR